MENAPRNKNQKTALRAIEKSFLKRKDCIKKKSMELSVLCDVKVCAIMVGPDGTVETWPENRNDVQRVIETYRNCPVDKKKRERPQELDRGGGNKKQKLCVVSEGAKKTGFTDQDMLRSIDAKLCEVRKKIQSMKSNDQNSVDYTMANSKEPSFFQETASFDQSHFMDNPLWFGTQLEEINGFEENDLLDLSEIFNTESENPKSLNPCSGLTDTYQDFQSSTPAVNLLTTGNELMDTYTYQDFQSSTPAVNPLTTGNELMDTYTYQDFQSSTPAVNPLTTGNELMDTFSMPYNGELNQFAATDLNSFISGCEAVNSFTLPDNQCYNPSWNWFEDSAFVEDLTSWHAAANDLWT